VNSATKHNHLKRPLLVPVAIAFMGLIFAFLGSILWIDSQHADEKLNSFTESIESSFLRKLDDQAALLSSNLLFISQTPCFRQAWKEQSRRQLLSCSQRSFPELQEFFQILELNFLTPGFGYFLRARDPERFGDLDHGYVARRAAATGNTAYGIELHDGGAAALLIARPWYDGGKVKGFIEVGIDLAEVLDHVASVYNVSLAIFTHKPGGNLDSVEAVSHNEPQPRTEDGVIDPQTEWMAQFLDYPWNSEERHITRYSRGDKEYAAGAFPLLDQGGRYIGFIGFTQDITQETLAGQKLLRHFLALFALTGLLLFFLFTRYVGRIEQHMDHSYQALRQEATKRKQVEASQRMLSRAVEQSGSAVVITDRSGRIEYINPRFTQITGYPLNEVTGKTPALLRSSETSQSTYQDLWSTILAGDSWVGDMRNRRKNGDLYWSRLSIAPIIGDDGKISNFVASSEDISHLVKANEEMEQLAFFDTLTGLPNRRLFRDRLERAIMAFERTNSGIALMFLDLDQFKRINDTLGHDAGDRLLKRVSSRLQQVIRKNDTIARLGGDEFTILLEKIDGAQPATMVARKIIEAMQTPFTLEGREVSVTTSIGITLAPEDGRDAGVLMKNADLAMYQAKESGRNNFQFFSQCMNEEIAQRVLLERELIEAVDQGQFELFYQPLVQMKDRRVIGVEALLRWRHPTRGILPPAAFLSVAEESSIINAIGRWVLQRACRDIKRLDQAFDSNLSVSVNLSARQFNDPDLARQMEEALNRHGLEGERLHLEITESMLLGESLNPIDMLKRLKALGVSLSIDDFGTGYSSLSYLKHFPVDQLKVDRSFVKDIPWDTDDMEITAAIIVLAHKLNLKVVAEGVETEQQLLFLQQNQCDLLQGYLFSRPLPFDALKKKLQEMEKSASTVAGFDPPARLMQ
jgi:diguanylate cyclase (GGDEF)-like protein/PAS domain S-box-containing protein